MTDSKQAGVSYTSEQVEAMAAGYEFSSTTVRGDETVSMLRAYAATLRQQDGRVDEAAKHWHDLYRKECRLRQDDAARYGQQIIDLEQAALAQNPKTLADFVNLPDAEREAIGQQVAERVDEMQNAQGEPVAYRWWDGTHYAYGERPSVQHSRNTPLYLHAERARVPDADALIDAYDNAVRQQRESGFLPPLAQQAANECVAHNRNRLKQALLAAPPQPAQDAEVES